MSDGPIPGSTVDARQHYTEAEHLRALASQASGKDARRFTEGARLQATLSVAASLLDPPVTTMVMAPPRIDFPGFAERLGATLQGEVPAGEPDCPVCEHPRHEDPCRETVIDADDFCEPCDCDETRTIQEIVAEERRLRGANTMLRGEIERNERSLVEARTRKASDLALAEETAEAYLRKARIFQGVATEALALLEQVRPVLPRTQKATLTRLNKRMKEQ